MPKTIVFIVSLLLFFAAGGQALAAWSCTSAVGGDGFHFLITFGPARGDTQAQATAAALKLCNDAQGIGCRIQSCTGTDLCGVCSDKLTTGLGNAARSSAWSRPHAVAAIAAYQTCITKNK